MGNTSLPEWKHDPSLGHHRVCIGRMTVYVHPSNEGGEEIYGTLSTYFGATICTGRCKWPGMLDFAKLSALADAKRHLSGLGADLVNADMRPYGPKGSIRAFTPYAAISANRRGENGYGERMVEVSGKFMGVEVFAEALDCEADLYDAVMYAKHMICAHIASLECELDYCIEKIERDRGGP